MEINENIIEDGLKFYNIEDKEYINKCYKCLNFIKQNPKFELKVRNLYNILYYGNISEISKLWKVDTLEQLFDCNYHSFITNILLICGYKIHINNMNKYKLDDNQCNIHKKRVRETLTNDIYIRKYNGIRISQMLWGSYFINLRLIEIGRLQYERSEINPITKQQEICVKIHIPTGKKLLISDVEESLIKSKEEIKRYFNIYNVKYYCTSWLLSKQIKELLGEDSNITKFQNIFNIIEGEDCISDILNFVYNIIDCTDYNNLQEDTSLQRKIKEFLLKGNTINVGIGTLS